MDEQLHVRTIPAWINSSSGTFSGFISILFYIFFKQPFLFFSLSFFLNLLFLFKGFPDIISDSSH